MRQTSRSCLLALAAFASLPSNASAWRFTLDGASTFGPSETVEAITTTADGDVVAAGVVVQSGSDTDLVVTKLSKVGGTPIWTVIIDGPAGSTDEAQDVVVDAAGDVIVGGSLQDFANPRTLTVLKLSGNDGTEIWRTSISIPLNPFVPVGALALDGDGDVFTVGTAVNQINGSGDFAVYKLSGADGTEQWRYTLDGTASLGDGAVDVAVDAAGNVAAGGLVTNAGTGADFGIVELAGATGAEIWRSSLNNFGSGGDQLRALALDGAGNVLATGSMVSATTQDDIAIVKLSGSTGAELWRRLVDGSQKDFDSASSIAVDSNDDVVAAGVTLTPHEDDFTVAKVRGTTGSVRWLRKIDGGAGESDTATAVTVDSHDNVIAVGGLSIAGAGQEFTVISFRPGGSTRWTRTIAGTTPAGFDIATCVAVDAADDVAAGGLTENVGTGVDFTVVGLDGNDGDDLP